MVHQNDFLIWADFNQLSTFEPPFVVSWFKSKFCAHDHNESSLQRTISSDTHITMPLTIDITVNCLQFQIVAGLMIVLGLTVYSRYHSFTFLYESAKAGRLFTPSILVVLLGMAMLVITSFGFFGSLKESTGMVNLVRIGIGYQGKLNFSAVC